MPRRQSDYHVNVAFFNWTGRLNDGHTRLRSDILHSADTTELSQGAFLNNTQMPPDHNYMNPPVPITINEHTTLFSQRLLDTVAPMPATTSSATPQTRRRSIWRA
jgi:hypothetical protein